MEIESNQYNKLLVVGGTGFIGQHIVKRALKDKFQITVLSKNALNISNKFEGVNYINADISDKSNLKNQLKESVFDSVINLAGYINHSDYSDGGDLIYKVHFNGVRNLVDCIDKSCLKSFIQIGSSDEYGNNSAPQFEGQRESPFSPYSFAKVASTHFLQTLFKLENFPAVILRPFLVYGPGQDEKRFIPQIIKGCLNDKKFPTSKGEQLRDFCFIDDFVSAVFLALENKNVQGEVINISSGKPISIRKVTELIVNMIGSGRPQFGHFDYRQGESMSLYAEIEKANDLLDWKPIVKIEKGIAETIKWMKSCKNEL